MQLGDTQPEIHCMTGIATASGSDSAQQIKVKRRMKNEREK